jgi:hypothetical protein
MHVIDGKVVPWATSSKWNPARYFTPFRTREIAKLEKQTQGLIDRMMTTPTGKTMNLKGQVLGLDVGIGKRGKPIIFELNPTISSTVQGTSYGSTQLLNPLMEDAIVSQAAGRMPLIQKLQMGRDAAQLGLGGTAAYHAAEPWVARRKKPGHRDLLKAAALLKISLQ